MDSFNAGSVQANITIGNTGLKSDMVTIESIFAKSSVVSGKVTALDFWEISRL